MAIFRKGYELRFSAPVLLALTQRRVGFAAGTTGAAYVQGHLLQAQYVPLEFADEGLQTSVGVRHCFMLNSLRF